MSTQDEAMGDIDELDAATLARADVVLFVGDSPNDEPMFRAFPLSLGVANIRALAHRIAAKPRYVTRGRSGEGFVELSDRILAARGSRRGH